MAVSSVGEMLGRKTKRGYSQGFFTPLNPRKYKGDRNQIVFRSSWEYAAFSFCDTEKAIVKWASEEIIIPYTSPVDNRGHRYFVDLWIRVRQPNGQELEYLVEIKPKDQVNEPKKGRGPKAEKRYQEAVVEYLTNTAKWQAARQWCAKNNMKFLIWTEDQIFPGKKTW